MELKLEFYKALCSTKAFKINGIIADYDDFGDKHDDNPEDAELYGCGNMIFDISEHTKEILIKYNITEKEYYEIADKLQEGLSFGNCGECI
jgi:hypothetical protein